MVSKEELGTLIGRVGRMSHPVLSVYLDVDQSRETNLHRKFEISLGNMLRELERSLEDQVNREKFIADAKLLTHFASEYRPSARGLVIFCDNQEDFLWHREINAPLHNEVRWSETLYLRPLIDSFDEFERYGVILTDRAQARLFTVHLGLIQEHVESFAPGEVSVRKSAGADRLLSQMRFQRKADQNAQRHLKRVAELTVELTSRYAFDRLLLAGPAQATGQIQQFLPKSWQSRVIATLNLPLYADQHEVLAATVRVSEEAERNSEIRVVENLISNAASAEQRAVVGLNATLRALRLGRIWTLVYANGFAPAGGRCIDCATLYEDVLETCAYCGASICPVQDLIEQAAQRVIFTDGKVEQVRGTASERLCAIGGVGAFLKF